MTRTREEFSTMQETKSNQSNRRNWVKNAIIIFLSIMLVLTLFSNTFMNMSLPEVTAVYTVSGMITNRITLAGNIEPNESYGIYADGSYTLKTVSVRVGDTVEKGQELATYEIDVSEELVKARKTLNDLQNAYDMAVLEADTSAVDSKAYRTVERAKETYDEALAAYNQYITTYNIPNSNPEYLLPKVEDEVKQVQKNLEVFQKGMTDYTKLHEKLAQLQTQKAQAMREYEKAKLTYDTQVGDSFVWDEKPFEVTQAMKDNAYQTMQIQAVLMDQINVESNLCYEKLNNLNSLASADMTQEEVLEMLNDLVEQATSKVEHYQKAKELYNNVENERLKYEDSKLAYQDQLSQQAITDKKTALTLKNKKDEIEAQKLVVASLEDKGQGATVKSPVSGVITTVFLQAGEKVSGGSQLFAVELMGKGYLLSTTVTSEQARQIKIGDKAAVQDWWNGDIDVTVAAIKNDPSNPGRSNIVDFIVTGNVNAGQSLKLSVGSRSASYDVLVPNNAIREDSNGKFILAVQAKSSPLGNRYYAKRIDVTALANDDKYTAVTGEIFGSEYVITTASSPVNAGTQVRLAQ